MYIFQNIIYKLNVPNQFWMKLYNYYLKDIIRFETGWKQFAT